MSKIYISLECGGILEEDYGVITSPNWPNVYNGDLYCRWEFTSSKTVEILDMDIGADDDLCTDYLRVDRSRYCGASDKDRVFHSTDVLRFHSKGSNIEGYNGFILIWYSSSQVLIPWYIPSKYILVSLNLIRRSLN